MQPSDNTKYGDYSSYTSAGSVGTSESRPSERWIISSVVNGTGSPRPKRFNSFGYLKYRYLYGRGSFHRSWVDGNGDAQFTTESGVTNYVSPPDGFLGPHPGTFRDEMLDSCMNKIYEQIRGQGNLIVDLAESHQTLRMLRDTVRFRKLTKDFLRGLIIPKRLSKVRAPRGANPSVGSLEAWQERTRYVSGKWLEYRYGWQPLIGSIYENMKTLLGDHILARHYPVKARTRRELVTVAKSPTVGGRVVTTEHTQARLLVECLFDVGYMNPVYDFTSLNPAAIAWELVPFSFVADWFVNFGDCLNAWENHTLFADRFVEGYTSYSHFVNRGRSSTFRDNVPIVPDNDRPGKNLPNPIGYSYRYEDSGFYEKEFRRSVLTSLPAPTGLRVKVKLNAHRFSDAAALIYQMVNRRPR